MNLKQELQKFSSLNVHLVGSDHHSPWSAFRSRSRKEPEDMCRDVFLVSNAQVFSYCCLAHPDVSTLERLRRPEVRQAANDYGALRNLGFTLEGCKADLFGADFKQRRRFKITFARVVMDEAHNIRNKSSKTFGWLKFLGVPIWLVSGSAGCMSPAQWDGWRGLLEQTEWKTHPAAKNHTNDRFSRLQSRFNAAARRPRIEQDPDDLDERARKQREECRRVLEEWGDLLRAVMIRRCATDKLWGQGLLPLPVGVVKTIDCSFKPKFQPLLDAYLDFERREKEEASKASTKSEVSKPSTKSSVGGELTKPKFDYSPSSMRAYLRCRVASTLPAVCLLPDFASANFLKGWVEELARRDRSGVNTPSILKSNLDFIIKNSPKLGWLQRFVRGLGRDNLGRPEKLLIFSSSPMILYCVDLCLEKWGIVSSAAWNTPPADRNDLYVSFQTEDQPRILTGTYRTMGEGATLTRAFRCVLMDPEWEIAREDQAIARIHRCGQKQNTEAYRLICYDGADGVVVGRHAGLRGMNEEAQHLLAGQLRKDDAVDLMQSDSDDEADLKQSDDGGYVGRFLSSLDTPTFQAATGRGPYGPRELIGGWAYPTVSKA
ncbi:hypothetical protein Q9L58_010651 [Maublancomyces gigas]|uniref:Helicase C-terminal domain-containing protein n=1 Tax=Discina gigas TaxID=1032678 RepID=A0ABR3G3I1_9PEZI